MQNTTPLRPPGNPQNSATPVCRKFVCRNHSTSAYHTSGAYRQKVRNTDSLLLALISRDTGTNLMPDLVLLVGIRSVQKHRSV